MAKLTKEYRKQIRALIDEGSLDLDSDKALQDILDTITDLRRQLAERDKPTKADCTLLDAVENAATQIHQEFDCLSDHVKTNAKIKEQIAWIINRHLKSALDAYVQERVAKARLEEAEWWRGQITDMSCDDTVDCDCVKCKRLAATRAKTDAVTPSGGEAERRVREKISKAVVLPAYLDVEP